MITLYTFGPCFGCPDASPFVMKAEMLLKLAGLPYQCSRRGLVRGPKGKLPYIDDAGTIVADSTLIRLYLERQYAIDFDRGLTARDRGVAWSVEKMLEDHLYWIMVYWRWMIDANFERGPKGFFKRAPAMVRPLIEMMVRRKVRATLHGHGIGRHNDAEKTALADRCIDAFSQVLGDNRYLLGDIACGADATACAFIAGAIPRVFDSPLRDKLEATPNLMAYHQRMMAEFFPAFAGAEKRSPPL
jgi:glutathione S-transferase